MIERRITTCLLQTSTSERSKAFTTRRLLRLWAQKDSWNYLIEGTNFVHLKINKHGTWNHIFDKPYQISLFNLFWHKHNRRSWILFEVSKCSIVQHELSMSSAHSTNPRPLPHQSSAPRSRRRIPPDNRGSLAWSWAEDPVGIVKLVWIEHI